MAILIKTLAAVAIGTVVGTSAFSQSATDNRVASPYVPVENEPAPKLFVDPPLAEGLAQGIFWTQYRVENLRIVPVFGAGALSTSPRVGHLHIDRKSTRLNSRHANISYAGFCLQKKKKGCTEDAVRGFEAVRLAGVD